MSEEKDSKRIADIIDALEILWRKYPQMRLWQLLENYIFTKGERGDKTSAALFLQEDSVTLRKINENR